MICRRRSRWGDRYAAAVSRAPTLEASTDIRVRWGDTDTSGRVYYGRIFGFFEAAEVEMWRSVDAVELFSHLPRVHAEADYRAALLFDDLITVHARLEKVGRSSVTIGFRIERGGETTCVGRTVAAHVPSRPHGEPVPLPDILRHPGHGSVGA